jgi:hypothetical protein
MTPSRTGDAQRKYCVGLPKKNFQSRMRSTDSNVCINAKTRLIPFDPTVYESYPFVLFSGGIYIRLVSRITLDVSQYNLLEPLHY